MQNAEQASSLAENKMGTMPIGRLLASMAIPMMISMMVQAFYNVVDSVFVARVSENALNAVSLAFPLQNLTIAVGIGTAVGMNAMLSRSLGEKNQEMVDKAANTGIFLSLCSFVIFAVIGLTLSRAFFLAQTDVMEIVDYGTDYATICLACSLGLFCQLCFERLLQSTGRTGLAMVTQLVGAVINIIINICHNHEVHIRLKMIRWNGAIASEIYRVGLPSIVMQSISSVMTFGINQILIAFSTTATAVFGAYFKLQSFVFMPVFGLNNAMVPIISYNYGAVKPERVKKTVRLSVIAATCIMIVGAAVFELFPTPLLRFFDASEHMLEIGVPALRIIAVHFVLAGFCIVAGSVCQAIGNPFYSLIVSVCRQLVVLLPVAWILSRFGRLELVWLAFPIAELMSLLMSSIFLRRTMVSAEKAMQQRMAE